MIIIFSSLSLSLSFLFSSFSSSFPTDLLDFYHNSSSILSLSLLVSYFKVTGLLLLVTGHHLIQLSPSILSPSLLFFSLSLFHPLSLSFIFLSPSHFNFSHFISIISRFSSSYQRYDNIRKEDQGRKREEGRRTSL